MNEISTGEMKLAGGVRVSFSFTKEKGLVTLWKPRVPNGMSRSLWRRYTLARNNFLRRVCEEDATCFMFDAEGIQTIRGEAKQKRREP